MPGLAALFFLTALLYGAAGFGGGSTYNALLVLAGTDYRAVPVIALACNILVVSVGSWRFARSGHVDWRRIWPLFVLSIPFAWLGGRLVVAETGLRRPARGVAARRRAADALAAAVGEGGAGRGPLRAGSSRWRAARSASSPEWSGSAAGSSSRPCSTCCAGGRPRRSPGTCAVFILANSLSGLAGQLAKGSGGAGARRSPTYWPLFPAVLAGGLIGSTLGSGRLDPKYVRILTALLILYVAAQAGDPLLWRDHGSRRMIDPFGRTISYLRLSVTDRCDLRCTYCMPERMAFLPRAELLSLDELDRLAAAFIRKGVRKLRLTGGEPLVRKDIIDLVGGLSRFLRAGDARRADPDHQRHPAGAACRRPGALRRPAGQRLARQPRSRNLRPDHARRAARAGRRRDRRRARRGPRGQDQRRRASRTTISTISSPSPNGRTRAAPR